MLDRRQLLGSAAAVGAASFITPAFAFLTPALGELVVFFAALFFFLVGRKRLRSHVVLLFATKEARLRTLSILNDIEENLVAYVGLVSLINLGLGAVTALTGKCLPGRGPLGPR